MGASPSVTVLIRRDSDAQGDDHVTTEAAVGRMPRQAQICAHDREPREGWGTGSTLAPAETGWP